jgi:Uma2 family endonuclease
MPVMEQPIPQSIPSTVEDYFRMEESSPIRHEFRRGQIIAMAGGLEPHSLIATNISGSLWGRLRGAPCRVYNPDLRVFAADFGEYAYPDVTVICGPTEFNDRKSAMNPRVIFEVLSTSTEAADRGEKFDAYREIPSFQQYVLVAQDRPYAQTFLRQPHGNWLMHPYLGINAVIRLESIEVELPLAEVYAGVESPPPVTKVVVERKP